MYSENGKQLTFNTARDGRDGVPSDEAMGLAEAR